MTFKREPAVIIAAVAAVIQGVAIYVTGNELVDTSMLLPILTLIAGFFIRSKVTPVNKIKR